MTCDASHGGEAGRREGMKKRGKERRRERRELSLTRLGGSSCLFVDALLLSVLHLSDMALFVPCLTGLQSSLRWGGEGEGGYT